MSRFYNKRAWGRLSAAKLIQTPLCEYRRDGIAPAVEVDHRVPINKGGAEWDWSNLVSCCHECHSKKTLHIDVMGRDRVPVRGVDAATGLPLDAGHWWRNGEG